MKDFVPLGSGNSRFLKTVNNAKTLYPTYDAFLNALIAGTLPIDLNGINSAGVAQMGTALNKANLLTDATAEALGLTGDPTVNDALGIMSRFANNLGNEYLWERVVSGTIYYETRGSSTQMPIYNSSAGTCGKSIEISQTDGSFRITSVIASTPFTESYAAFWASQIPFYCMIGADLYYIDGSVVSSGSAAISFSAVSPVTIAARIGTESFGFVNSSKPNAYPPAEADGYKYSYRGQLGSFAKIETGSYVGTGSSGSSNPNSLTFGFVPKYIHIRPNAGGNYVLALVHGTINSMVGYYTGNPQNVAVTWDGNTVSWYAYNGVAYQLNNSNTTYNYAAIG